MIDEEEIRVPVGRQFEALAFVHAVCVSDNPSARLLSENRLQGGRRNHARRDHVVQYVAGTHAGQLVGVADEDQGASVGNRPQKSRHQFDVHHRNLVQDKDIALERVFGTMFEVSRSGHEFQHAVDGLGGASRGFLHALGGPPGRRGQSDDQSAGAEDLDQGADDRRLADAGSAGDDGHLFRQGHGQGFGLPGGEVQIDLFLRPGNGLVHKDGSKRGRCPAEGDDFGRHVVLRAVKAGRKDAILLPDQGASPDFVFQGFGQNFRRDIEQGLSLQDQLRFGTEAMAFVGQGAQDMDDTGAGAHFGMRGDAHAHGDAIGRLEADAPDIGAEAVGIFRDEGDGLIAVLAEDPGRLGGADPVALEEDHDVAYGFLFDP